MDYNTRWYVYYSYEQWGRGYIGYRGCQYEKGYTPETEPYWGTYSDRSFKPTEKIILFQDLTQEEALEIEIYLHKFYDVDNNDHFANKAKQTSIGFCYSASGENHYRHGKKIYNNGIREINISPDEEIPEGYFLGRLPEIRIKLSEAMRGENSPIYGKTMYNNGIENKYFFPGEEIPEGYILGGKPLENFKLSVEERKMASSKGGKKASKYMSNSKWINDGVINKRVPKDYCINTGWELGKVKNNKNKLKKELLKLEKCDKGKLEEEKRDKRKIEEELKIKERLNIILNSNIDYTSFGWVVKLSNLLGVSTTHVRRFIKKYIPDFYINNNCFVRKHK